MFVHKTSKVGILVYIVYQTRIEQEICQKKGKEDGKIIVTINHTTVALKDSEKNEQFLASKFH